MGVLTITESAGVIIFTDSIEGVVFYKQQAVRTGSNGTFATMPDTSTGIAPYCMFSGQRTSNTPLAINNCVAIGTTGGNIYSKFVNTNANANYNASVTWFYIKPGSWSSSYGDSVVTGGSNANGRFMEVTQGGEDYYLCQLRAGIASTGGVDGWDFPIAMPDSNYVTIGTTSAVNARYVTCTNPLDENEMQYRVWNRSIGLVGLTFLGAEWIK